MKHKRIFPIIFLTISITLYFYSLSQEAFVCETRGLLGYEVLVYGWLGFITLDPRWITNILYFWMVLRILKVGEVKLFRWVPALSLFLAFASMLIASMGCEFSGGAANISKHLAVGGYVWVVSVVLISLVVIFTEESQSEPLSSVIENSKQTDDV